jgi:hypothetical protein
MTRVLLLLLTLLFSLSGPAMGEYNDFGRWSNAANNAAVRQGYLNALEAIPGQINTTVPLREQAMQAFNLRNAAKIDARAAMADGGALLYKTDPIPTIQDVVRRAYQDKGLVGDDM